MDYVIIFYVLGAALLVILERFKWLAAELILGALFLLASAMVYLMEGKKLPHEMEKRTPIFDRIEEECEMVVTSAVSAQIARRMRRHLKAQPPLAEEEYYAVFCGEKGVEVVRKNYPTAEFRYVAYADGCRCAYGKIRSREGKRALAEMLAEKAAELPEVYVGKVRRCAEGAMFTVICDKGFEREEKREKTEKTA